MAIYLKSPIYIYIYIYKSPPPITIHFPPFINHLKITFCSAQTKIKPFYYTKFAIAPVKGFRPVRDMPECTSEFSNTDKKI